MKGHTIFTCMENNCPVITFFEWSNQADSASTSNCPRCNETAYPTKAIFNKEFPEKEGG